MHPDVLGSFWTFRTDAVASALIFSVCIGTSVRRIFKRHIIRMDLLYMSLWKMLLDVRLGARETIGISSINAIELDHD